MKILTSCVVFAALLLLNSCQSDPPFDCAECEDYYMAQHPISVDLPTGNENNDRCDLELSIQSNGLAHFGEVSASLKTTEGMAQLDTFLAAADCRILKIKADKAVTLKLIVPILTMAKEHSITIAFALKP